ncbi:J domain-containing protein [Candidatus Dependentiae bacterium]
MKKKISQFIFALSLALLFSQGSTICMKQDYYDDEEDTHAGEFMFEDNGQFVGMKYQNFESKKIKKLKRKIESWKNIKSSYAKLYFSLFSAKSIDKKMKKELQVKIDNADKERISAQDMVYHLQEKLRKLTGEKKKEKCIEREIKNEKLFKTPCCRRHVEKHLIFGGKCALCGKPVEPKPEEKYKKILKENNYYKILGVSQDANNRSIKTAYRKAIVMCHPDTKNIKDEDLAVEISKKINEAYEALFDKYMRIHHDWQLMTGMWKVSFKNWNAIKKIILIQKVEAWYRVEGEKWIKSYNITREVWQNIVKFFKSMK